MPATFPQHLLAVLYVISIPITHYNLTLRLPNHRYPVALSMAFIAFLGTYYGNHLNEPKLEILLTAINLLFQLKFLDSASTRPKISSWRSYILFISQTNPPSAPPSSSSSSGAAAPHSRNWTQQLRKPVYPHQRTLGYYFKESIRLFVYYWIYVGSRVAYEISPWDFDRVGFASPLDLKAVWDAIVFFFMLWPQVEIHYSIVPDGAPRYALSHVYGRKIT
ncbi:hypothetical protein HDV05_004886 [Chytridiales sp. JEL 0842]|nr:hypothetical protein HDV05_004886 [Chytridiales sp. JEL 0842]